MRREDFKEFAELLDAAFDLIGKTPVAKIVSPTSKALFFQSLVEFPLPAVRSAIGEHIKRGEFTPTPAAIIKIIEGASAADTRPGPEEAWATALASQDERDTVVWTAETAEAFTIARPVLDSSGPISGRKTFLEAYQRLVAVARQAQRPAAWGVHLGFDKSQHALVLGRAVASGRLPAPAVAGMLPPPEDAPGVVPAGERLLLAGPDGGKVPELAPEEQEKARAQLAKIKRMLDEGQALRMARLDAAIDGRVQTEDEFKHDLAQRVQRHAAYIRMADQAQVIRAEGEVEQRAAESGANKSCN